MSRYIDAEKLKRFVEGIGLTPQKSADYNDGRDDAKRMALDFIDSLQREQESVAERFAKIVRGNLIGIDEETQRKFESLYFEITGNKMYGGYND